MPRKWVERQERDPRGWMFTFSDLVTLLLTFFVMMLAVRLPEIDKLRQAFGTLSKAEATPPGLPAPLAARELERLIEGLQPPSPAGPPAGLPGVPEPGLPAELTEGLSLRRGGRGLVITLAADLLFAEASARLEDQARGRIAKLGELLRHLDAPVSVEGHTDDRLPAAGGPFRDNWDLSLARAQAVARELMEQAGLDPARLRVGAMADTRPRGPNDTPQGRAANRRTEIVVLAEPR